MIQYEPLEPWDMTRQHLLLSHSELPELVHLDDPALNVMRDFSFHHPSTCSESTLLNEAIAIIKTSHDYMLLVLNQDNRPIGILSSSDLFGEKPIQIQQQKRIERELIQVHMLMTHIETLPIYNYETIHHARVGNVVNSLKKLHALYALVGQHTDQGPILRGLFTTSQINKQLHHEINNKLLKAESVSELNKRK